MMIPPPPTPDAQFNPPPNWRVPIGFDPRRGHIPDPAWPSPPTGWPFWVRPTRTMGSRGYLSNLSAGKIIGGVILAFFAIGLAVQQLDLATTPKGEDSCWARVSGNEYEPVRCSSGDADYVVTDTVSSPTQCPPSVRRYFEDNGEILCLRPY